MINKIMKSNLNLVFLHPFPLDNTFWENQKEFFSESFNVIIPDLFGFGLNTNHGYSFSIDHQCQFLFKQLSSTNLDKFVLIGCSLGGYVALRFAELFPQKVEAIILTNTHPFPDTDVAKAKRTATINLLREFGVEKFANEFVPSTLSNYSLENRSHLVPFLKQIILKKNVEEICAAIMCLAARTNTTNFLEETKIPILLISGNEDTFIDKEQNQKTIQLNKSIKSEILDNTGHFSPLEDFQNFNNTLNKFLLSLE